MSGTVVCFNGHADPSQYTSEYRSLWEAALADPVQCQVKCRQLISDNSTSPAMRVYALAGLRLCNCNEQAFQHELRTVRGMSGQFMYSIGGSATEQRQLSDVSNIFRMLTGPSSFADPTGRRVPNLQPPVATARAPAPQHRPPTCDSGHRMEVQLLHVSAFCDQCKMPLPETVPAWSCERCDADLCFPCAIIKFAPQVLAGGASGPVPIGGGGVPPPVRPPVCHQQRAQRENIMGACRGDRLTLEEREALMNELMNEGPASA